MKKLYSTIMMIAMMIAALGFVSCGDDDEEINDNSIVGVWEVVSIDFNSSDGIESELRVGDRLYINADGTYEDSEDSGGWTLSGKTLTFIANGDYYLPAVFKVSKLTSNDLVLIMDYGLFNATVKYKRVL